MRLSFAASLLVTLFDCVTDASQQQLDSSRLPIRVVGIWATGTVARV